MRLLIAIGVLLTASVASAHEGWGIALDRHGHVYVADVPTNTIWKVSPDGELSAAAPNQHTHAIGSDAAGNIWGSHENGSVWRIEPSGRLALELLPGEGFPLSLHSFVRGEDGSIYSMNAGSVQSGQVTLMKRAPDGRVSTVAGGARGLADGRGAAARFTSIDGMAWGPDGALYITDETYVRRVSVDGEVTTIAGPLTREKWDEDLMGITVLANGHMLVADYSQRRIVELSPAGQVIRTAATSRWPWAPTGMVMRGSDLYVLEHLRSPLVLLGNIGIGAYARVRKLSPDGARTMATIYGRHTRLAAVIAAVVATLTAGAIVRRRARSL